MSRWLRLKWRNIHPEYSGLAIAGVYVVFGETYAEMLGGTVKDLMYIGYTQNIRSRLKQHKMCENQWGNIDSPWIHHKNITIAVRPDRIPFEGASLELRLIKRLNPLCNSCHTRKNKGYEE